MWTSQISRFLTYFLLTFMQNVGTIDYVLLGGSKFVDYLWIIRRTLLYLSRYLAHLYKDKGVGQSMQKVTISHHLSLYVIFFQQIPPFIQNIFTIFV